MLSYRIALSRCAYGKQSKKRKTHWNVLYVKRANKKLNFLKINNQMALYKKENLCTKCYRDYIHFDNFDPLPMKNAAEAFAIYKVPKKPDLNFCFYKAIAIIILCLNVICYLCLPLLMENVCFQTLVSFRKKPNPTPLKYIGFNTCDFLFCLNS